jgi:hypothetical protein
MKSPAAQGHRPRQSARTAWFQYGCGAILIIATLAGRPAWALFEEQPGPFPREGECNLDDPAFDGIRDLLGPDNNIGPGSLKTLAVPEPSNLERFVRDRQAAMGGPVPRRTVGPRRLARSRSRTTVDAASPSGAPASPAATPASSRFWRHPIRSPPARTEP